MSDFLANQNAKQVKIKVKTKLVFCFVIRCEAQPSDSSAPLATNDSDDDISDDETTPDKCEEAFFR